MKNRKDALSSITHRTRVVRGCKLEVFDCYLGSLPDGKKVRLSASTEEALREKIIAFYRKAQTMGDSVLVLKPVQVYDAKQALDLLGQNGVNLTLTDVVKEFLKEQESVTTIEDLKIGVAYDRYMESFDNPSEAQVHCLLHRVKPWVQDFGPERLLSEVTKEEFEHYVKNLKKIQSKGFGRTVKTNKRVSPKTRNGVISYCKTFMQWCADKGFAASNPIARVETETIIYKEPEYSKVEDVRKLFGVLKRQDNKKMIAYAALSFFCGIRAAEIDRIEEDKKAFVLEDDTIRISTPKGYTKGIMPRVIKVEPNAKAWLEFANAPEEMYHGAKIPSIRNMMHRLMDKFNIPFPHNTGRHSFITYHVAKYQNPSKTEALAGTSARMRAKHYMGLATVAQGKEYFDIMP